VKTAEATGTHGRDVLAAARPAPELRLLNASELTVGGKRVPLPLPAQRVVAFLALNGRPVRRAALAEKLWSDVTGAHALGSLRSALWRLRTREVPILSSSNGDLGLRPDVRVDVRGLLAWARSQLEGTPSHESDLVHVHSACELLPDWYDDWVLLERERLREVHVRALEALCDRLIASAEYPRANEVARAAIGGDPLRESAHRCLVRLHLAEGNQAEAIRAYRFFERILLHDLGLEPSSQMKSLVAEVMVE
jgi:DNA-binding SARP family transcriptional activator